MRKIRPALIALLMLGSACMFVGCGHKTEDDAPTSPKATSAAPDGAQNVPSTSTPQGPESATPTPTTQNTAAPPANSPQGAEAAEPPAGK